MALFSFSKGRRFGALAGVVLALAFSGSVQGYAAERTTPQDATQVKLSFAPVVKQVAPAVVNVYAQRRVRERVASPFDSDPFFRRFFGGNSPFGAPRTRERVKSSLGSGVIVSKDGTIITNHHVIEGAQDVRVVLSDKREFEAKVLLKDERTDLAILKIDGEGADLPMVEFADSDGLEVGDLVLAIGNPFGVGQTVTQGIVSAVARTQVGVSDYQFFIQTDAAINPGNSGGALVDVDGKLVGINTAIFSRSGGSNGIGFAIPGNMAKIVATAAGHGDVVRRPWVGAKLQPVSQDIAASLGMDRPNGVMVTRVLENSPAQEAGLKVGDLITAVAGEQVSDPNSFGYRLVTQELGSDVAFAVLRDGEALTLSVHMRVAPESVPRDRRELKGTSPFAGSVVMNLSPAVAEELRMGDETAGVVVAEVLESSRAAYVGFRRGDIVLEVNGESVDSAKQLAKLSKRKIRTWHIKFRREGRDISTTLRL
ncbi:DegQ family serine endoprotease [Polycladidibacter hongkongensis]|uniref:DegQ family serine endoprotease n=1 Tax=Polycladidibacter hongkongensis TaxID=1647556 RepID=UPI0009EB9EDA|nr:DegQ family serine endoprotease [Pseudovibrio hongkongensis]